MARPGVTFLMPVLNEAATLPLVLAAIARFRKAHMKNRPSEVLVSDNGSTDGSQAIARKAGARVIHCPVRGYGAAVRFGIANAKFPFVVFADADFTYDFEASAPMIAQLDAGADLVLSSRLNGRIEPGAMPFMHRYVGTPVLTGIVNLLHNRGQVRLSDCNAGHRAVRRDAHQSWGCRSDGMEYASELCVEALRHRADVREVPGTLAKDQPGRKPHMRTWRDGMRNVLQITVVAPQAFALVGGLLWAASWLVLVGALAQPAGVALGRFHILGPHSMLFALLGSLAGLSIWSVALFLGARDPERARGTAAALLKMPEDRLFFLSLLGAGLSAFLLGSIVYAWGRGGFVNMTLERPTIAVAAFVGNVLRATWYNFGAHLLKRLWRLESNVLGGKQR